MRGEENHRIVLAALVAALAGTTTPLLAQSVLWDGDAGDGFWNTADNWDPDNVPGSGANVTIPGDAGPVTLSLAGGVCATIDCQSALIVDNAGLSVGGTGSVQNLTLNTSAFFGSITTAGEFTVSGVSTSNGGRVTGTGSFINAGVFNAPSFRLEGTDARNDGSWSMAEPFSQLALIGSSRFTNNNGLAIANGSTVDGTGEFINNGTIAMVGPAGIEATISNTFTQLGGEISAPGQGHRLQLTGAD